MTDVHPAPRPGSRPLARVLSQLANGVLLYAIFYGFAWVMFMKGSILAHMACIEPDGVPDLVNGALVPLVLSALAAFMAHAGLRLTLKRLRLRLSTSEIAASRAFLGVLTLFAFTGTLTRLFDMPESHLVTPLAIIAGGWIGAMLRRRVAL
ncbi:MAG TPA: hypothetical protein VEB20_00710 [Azospirillaceae bacterium]|nr:hypothetical protein [Azospirillaceae bacterium]